MHIRIHVHINIYIYIYIHIYIYICAVCSYSMDFPESMYKLTAWVPGPSHRGRRPVVPIPILEDGLLIGTWESRGCLHLGRMIIFGCFIYDLMASITWSPKICELKAFLVCFLVVGASVTLDDVRVFVGSWPPTCPIFKGCC